MTRERPEDGAVLAELERFRLAIEFCRARRDETGEDFEAFVRARMPAAREPARARGSDPRPAASPAATPLPAAAVPPPAAAAPAAIGQPLAPSSRSIFFETTAAELADAELEAEEPARSRRGWLAGAAIVLLLAGAAAIWMLRSAPDRSAVETTAAVPAPSAEPAAPAAAAAPTPAPPPAPPSPVLTTTRAVWLRVLADGARVLEREVPAGTRVPLRAASTIVIRTGDGGAVLISLAGEEPAALGRDGQVVTRTFTLPAR